MIEEIELRCSGEVKRYLDKSLYPITQEMKNIASTTLKIVLKSDDERWNKIIEACRIYDNKWEKRNRRRRGKRQPDYIEYLYSIQDAYRAEAKKKGWKITSSPGYSVLLVRRKYTPKELESAKLLHFRPVVSTSLTRDPLLRSKIYDDSEACTNCRVGMIQKSDLVFNLNTIPKSRDIISGYACAEIIISRKLSRLMEKEKITGYKTRPIRHRTIDGKISPDWLQLVVLSTVGKAAPQTKYGDDFFHPDINLEDVCPSCGRNSGMNIISELYICQQNWDGSDIAKTTNLVGGGKGLGFPQPMLVISQKLYQIFKQSKIRGYKGEVAHMVKC